MAYLRLLVLPVALWVPALKQREQSGRKALLRLSPAEISFRPCRNDFPPDWGLFCEQRTQDFLGLCSV